ncbi:YncE family protein [Actinomadura viridis]|uniref:YncE family protein n=1 Tax=Actinomadura viridis TaxID=58110 RepID=UPI0036D196AC
MVAAHRGSQRPATPRLAGRRTVPRAPRRVLTAAASTVTATTLVTAGCAAQIPFHRPGEGAPGAPLIPLGGPAPFATTGRGPAEGPASPAPPGRTVDVYAATGAGMLSPAVRGLPHRVYVPNAATGTADVIDQRTGRLLERLPAGGAPTLIVTGPDLRRLWITGLGDGRVLTLAPGAARPAAGPRISRPGPLYFTPDGRAALVMAGRSARIDVRDPRTLKPRGTIRLPCPGAVRADFTADASALLTACPSTGQVIRVDPARRTVTATLRLPAGSRPGDLRLSRDGRAFLVADTARGGLWTIDAARPRALGFVRTGPGPHGLVLGRDARLLYVLGGDGTVSAVDQATRRVSRLWRAPGRRALLPGGVSADGGTLWLSDPAGGTVYALSTRTGRPLHTVRVGGRPGGPSVHPQPGRRSLGGPGLFR